MRKQQIALLERAKQDGNFSQLQINTLSREDWPMEILRTVYRYFHWQNNLEVDKELTNADANKWVDFLIQKKKEGKFTHKCDFAWIFDKFFCTYKDKDVFAGDKRKIYYWNAYRFIEIKKAEFFNTHEISTCERNDIDEDCIHIYMLFCRLFERGIPIKTIKPIVKFSAQLHNRAYAMRRLFDKFPALYDDCIHNVENSLIFYLMRNILVVDEDFDPSESTLNQLYDFDNHKFIFKPEDFRKYFTYESDSYCVRKFQVSEDALLLIAKDKYPIVNTIHSFCKDNNLIKNQYDKYKNVFGNWSQWGLWDNTQTQKLLDCYKILGKQFRIAVGAWSIHVEISTNHFITVTYHEYNTITVVGKKNLPYEKNPYGWTSDKPQYTSKLLITPDGKIFITYGKTKAKNIPMPFRTLLFFKTKQNPMQYLVKTIIDFHKQTNPFINDLFEDSKANGCLIPISFNDTIGYHNRSHFITSQYKTSHGLKVNWNKINTNLAYLIIKAQTWVDVGISKQILLQQRNALLIPDSQYNKGIENKLIEFLFNVINNRILDFNRREYEKKIAKAKQSCQSELYDEVKTTLLPNEITDWTNDRINDMTHYCETRRVIIDYINMCRRTKEKIRLDIRSIEQLTNLHDGLAFVGNRQRTHTGVVKIPKKSKFNQLREILPQEFEWIKTRKRLILETELQHHCVWSYADKITTDNCAIYSFVDSTGQYAEDNVPRRYTIEFACKNNQYSIVQVQGQYDRIHTVKMKEYINSILNPKKTEK